MPGGRYPLEPFDDGPDELDDLRADIAQLEDELLGLEHDLVLVSQILRSFGVTVWGTRASVEDLTGAGVELSVEVTEDQAAVLDRLSML